MKSAVLAVHVGLVLEMLTGHHGFVPRLSLPPPTHGLLLIISS